MILPTSESQNAEMRKDPFYWVMFAGLLFLMLIATDVLHELIGANAVKKWQLENDRTISQLRGENEYLKNQLVATTDSSREQAKGNTKLSSANKTLTDRLAKYEMSEPLKTLHGRAITVVYNQSKVSSSQKTLVAQVGQKEIIKPASQKHQEIMTAQEPSRKPATKATKLAKIHDPNQKVQRQIAQIIKHKHVSEPVTEPMMAKEVVHQDPEIKPAATTAMAVKDPPRIEHALEPTTHEIAHQEEQLVVTQVAVVHDITQTEHIPEQAISHEEERPTPISAAEQEVIVNNDAVPQKAEARRNVKKGILSSLLAFITGEKRNSSNAIDTKASDIEE